MHRQYCEKCPRVQKVHGLQIGTSSGTDKHNKLSITHEILFVKDIFALRLALADTDTLHAHSYPSSDLPRTGFVDAFLVATHYERLSSFGPGCFGGAGSVCN